MASPHRIAQLRANVADIKGAADSAALARLYVDFIGYDPFDDCPGIDPEEVRETLREYVKEICYSEGVHVFDVFGEEDIY